MSDRRTRGVSYHILGAAATLLGISFAIVSIIGAFGHSEKTLVDDFALVSLILFLASCLFSYASMRSLKRAAICEAIADALFILALLSLGVLSIALYFGLCC